MKTATETESGFPPPGDAEVRATAWALGELDAVERAAFEKEMAADPALAAYAREMRAFCAAVGAELPADTDGQLPQESRLRVAAALGQPAAGSAGPFLRRHWKPLSLAAAAGIGVTLNFLPVWREPENAGKLALSNPPAAPASTASAAASPSSAPVPGGTPAETVTWTSMAGGIRPFPPSEAGHTKLHQLYTSAAPVAATEPAAVPVTIRPVMPHTLFQGTPLPAMTLPPNFDRSQKPVLEVQVPPGTVLLSKGCPVTSSDPDPIGDLSLITDGDKQGDDGYFVDLVPGKVWVTIDLGKTAEINLLWVWHFHKQAVIYRDVVAQVSDDPEFRSFTTVFNNDYDNSLGFGAGPDQSYRETNHGRAMPVKGVRGRYVRLHSAGRDLDDTNQYIEVEVYGRPLEPAAGALLADAGPPPNAVPSPAPAPADSPAAAPAPVAAASAPGSSAVPDPASAPPAAGPEAAKLTRQLQDLASSGEARIRPAMPAPLFAGTPLDLYHDGAASAGSRPPASGRTDFFLSYQSRSPELTNQGYPRRSLFPGSPAPGTGTPPSRTPALTTALSDTGEAEAMRRRMVLPEAESLSPLRSEAEQENPTVAESYQRLPVNPFLDVTREPLSTFSIDVDTASYANVRRFLNAGGRPPAEAVRLEELVNYFPYNEPGPADGKPFAVRVEMTSAPWNPGHRLARVVLKGKEIPAAERPAGNLVFLVDVSGSMSEPAKLPLVQQSLRLLTERLTENDRVSLVTYAGGTQLVLPPTHGGDKQRILAAIDSLSGGGGTNGAGGIAMAYQQAAAGFIQGGTNRVILATDGDFNIGATSHEDLLGLITEKAKSGVFLSVLGYGMGNLKDDTMELLADKGNGNYAYIDSLGEARKTLVEQMSGTLVTIAKDVKIQIEFNPAAVKSYKLLGYENRLLAKEDFNNDKKDAGEIGAGHTVTALYEIVPAGAPDVPVITAVDGLKYQQSPPPPAPKPEVTPAAASGEMMNVKLRWKQPQAGTSELMEIPVRDTGTGLDQASGETRWAVAVAGFARLLRGDLAPGAGGNSPAAGTGTGTDAATGPGGGGSLTWESVRLLARGAKGPDPLGYRGEFLQLIDKAESLSR